MEAQQSSNIMSTLYDKWCSLKRGDIILIEGEKEELIVSHSISSSRDTWTLTFQNCYTSIWQEDEKLLKDFTIVGHYLLPKDKELNVTKARW